MNRRQLQGARGRRSVRVTGCVGDCVDVDV